MTPIQQFELPLNRSAISDPSRAIGVCEKQRPDYILQQALAAGIGHVVQRDGVAFDRELESARAMIDSPRQFSRNPLSSVLTPNEASGQRESDLTKVYATASLKTEKNALLKIFSEPMQGILNEGLMNDMKLIVSELASNALKHGPRDGGEVKPCQLSLGHDDQRLVIACDDAYGTMAILPVLERIRRSFEFGMRPMINFEGGGAGIGLFMVFRAAVSLYFVVNEGKRTTVCAVLPMRGSQTQREAMSKNLHFFTGKFD